MSTVVIGTVPDVIKAEFGTIKAVLFDKDGTLIDFHRTWGPLNRRAAVLAAGEDPELARRLMAMGGMDPVSLLTRGDSLLAAASNREIAAAWANAGAVFDEDELAGRLDALFTSAVDVAVPVTDLGALFGRLAGRGFALGIASSDSEAAIRRTVERFGLSASTAFVAGYDSGHGRKPGPGMMLAFCAAVGVDPSQTAMVGDNMHDIEMGRAARAGLVVAVGTGTGDRAVLEPAADVWVASVDDLGALLDETAATPLV